MQIDAYRMQHRCCPDRREAACTTMEPSLRSALPGDRLFEKFCTCISPGPRWRLARPGRQASVAGVDRPVQREKGGCFRLSGSLSPSSKTTAQRLRIDVGARGRLFVSLAASLGPGVSNHVRAQDWAPCNARDGSIYLHCLVHPPSPSHPHAPSSPVTSPLRLSSADPVSLSNTYYPIARHCARARPPAFTTTLLYNPSSTSHRRRLIFRAAFQRQHRTLDSAHKIKFCRLPNAPSSLPSAQSPRACLSYAGCLFAQPRYIAALATGESTLVRLNSAIQAPWEFIC